jgi:hypothetical protein
VRRLARKYDHVQFLPTYDLYNYEAGALVVVGNSVIYHDDNHLLRHGADMVIPRLRDKIMQILSKP